MFEDACDEGINGHCYSEEMELSGEYNSVRGFSRPFVSDPLYYFRDLFVGEERHKHTVAHETEKAVLFEVDSGQFWVPKALLRANYMKVHNSFRRNYLSPCLSSEWRVHKEER